MLIFKGSQVIKYYVMFAFLFVQTVLSKILHLQCLKYQKRAITQKLLKKKFPKISPNTSLIIPFQLTQVSSFYL